MSIKAKPHMISIRLSDADYKVLSELIKEEDESVSNIIRKALRYYKFRKLYEGIRK